jgi:hypothetical protein
VSAAENQFIRQPASVSSTEVANGVCVFWGRRRSRVAGGETSLQEGPDQARSAPLGRRVIQQGPQHRPFFPHA